MKAIFNTYVVCTAYVKAKDWRKRDIASFLHRCASKSSYILKFKIVFKY